MTQENKIQDYNNSETTFEKYIYGLKSTGSGDYTHTRIGDREKKIYGGVYNIENIDEFSKKYHEYVFEKGNPEYLTERQLIENGPVLIDVDFRFEKDVKTRLVTKDHIIDLIMLYMTKINEVFIIPDNTKIDVYVSQKDRPNILPDKTKDGIHMIIGLKSDHIVQGTCVDALFSASHS